MTRKAERKTGSWLYPAAAGIAALCLLMGYPLQRAYAEDAIVTDSQPAEEDSSPGQTADAGVDPAQVDGLFEVVSEKSGYSGESDADNNKKKDKKKSDKKLIVGYRQVGCQASIHFEMGEKPSLERLKQQFPTKLDVYFLGEKKSQSVDVTWESYSDDYSTTNLNYYFFIPTFDENKYEVKGLNLQSESPYIEVIQNAFTFEMIDSAPPKENEAAVVKYCMEKLGLNTAATCGVLANIYCESGFRTNAIGDGGTSVGICQWHNSRWTNLRNFAPDDWQTLKGQLRFMRKELLGGYRATLEYIRNVPDDEQGAYDAAYYWCMHYEMPDKILSRSTTRGYLAKNVYWKRYGLGEEETEAEEVEGVLTAEEETEEDAIALTAETETEEDVKALTTETETEEDAKALTAETETEEEAKTKKDSYAGEYRCISDDGLNIREERTVEANVAGFIPFEGIVTVLSGDGEWARVRYDGKEGYSKLEFLEKVPDPEQTETPETGEDMPSSKKKKKP